MSAAIEQAVREHAERAAKGTEATPLPRTLDPRDPLGTARRIVHERYRDGEHRTLHAWRGDLRAWNGSHYPTAEAAAVRAELYEYLEAAKRPGSDGPEPFKPNTASVNNVLDALNAAVHLDGGITPPAWLDGRAGPDPRELLACSNGLLHLTTRDLLPHSPTFFTTHALPYAYAPKGEPPHRWLQFLDELWGDDPDAASTLQEIFGCLLGGETRHQKMFLLVGPKRSGKGTIARVLRALLGEANVAGPTLSALASQFGLQSLIDRPLAIISDARLSGRVDQAIIVERLLSISGEDVLTVDRKHREPWIGQLPTRLLMLTNELPRLADTSGALASRFVVLTLPRSWYGREDVRLTDELLKELPGILRWALDGFDRLRERGYFAEPSSSAAAKEELEDLASPVGAFVRECCIVEPGAEVETGALYQRWRRWCEERGRDHPGTEAVFGRDLRACVPGVSRQARRSGPERFRVYAGIRLGGIL